MWAIPAAIIAVLFFVLMLNSMKDSSKIRAADISLSNANKHLKATIEMNEKARKALEEAVSILEAALVSLNDAKLAHQKLDLEREELDLERERLRTIASRLSQLDNRAET